GYRRAGADAAAADRLALRLCRAPPHGGEVHQARPARMDRRCEERSGPRRSPHCRRPGRVPRPDRRPQTRIRVGPLSRDSDFLARWSARKQKARTEPEREPETTPAEAAPAPAAADGAPEKTDQEILQEL